MIIQVLSAKYLHNKILVIILAAFAEDEDVGVGLIVGSPVEIHEDIAAELIPAKGEAVGI